MRVRGRLAATFGGLALASALSIIWAFVSPDAPSEISSIDYFNLVWAGIAMVLAFVAYLVCFEHPRDELMFRYNVAGHLESWDRLQVCQVVELSPGRVVVALPDDSPPIDTMGPLTLFLPGVGRIEAVSEPAASRNRGGLTLRLAPMPTQHRAIIVLLYATPRDSIARQAHFTGALKGLLRRSVGLT